jgi:hypothetical protein
MSDIYKFAAQNKLLFPSRVGMLNVEQLFDLPLRSTRPNGADLDDTARKINAQLKGISEESFVEDITVNPQKQALTVALDVVKDVIATKQAENRAALAKTQRAAERKKLLDILAAKKDEKLSQASIEELEKQLAALDG